MWSLDERGLPLGILIIVLIVIPCAIGVFFGMFAFKGMTPLAFECHRCGQTFTRKAWRRFPRRCTKCGSDAWNR